MSDFTRIDPNFRLTPVTEADGLLWRDAREPVFSLHGLRWENGCWRRLPEAVARSASPGVLQLHTHTAGGCLRFRTDSRRVALRAAMHNIEKMSHFALTGSCGFDLYERTPAGPVNYLTTFVPPFGLTEGYSSQRTLPEGEMRELWLYFPLYSGVSALTVGLEPDARLEPAPAFSAPPVVFYGSSITQGGCASKPGSAFPAIVGQLLGVDTCNLGFSGSCKGEPAMADYLAAQPMSVFVCGYDHNAPSAEHLAQTLPPLALAVRKAHPSIPILLLNRPKARLDEEEQRRRAIVQEACRQVNGVFLPGERLIPPDIAPWATVDGTHPNDLGFYSMARAVADALVHKPSLYSARSFCYNPGEKKTVKE